MIVIPAIVMVNKAEHDREAERKPVARKGTRLIADGKVRDAYWDPVLECRVVWP